MAIAQLSTISRFIHDLRASHETAALADEDLLEQFIVAGSEGAFALLVRRHGPMVKAVTQRILSNHHDAEDALQATFLVLAQRATSIRKRRLLASWLHGVACRTALKLRGRRRSRRHEPLPDDVAAPQSADALVWRDLRALLDAEIELLPEKYRAPFILCYLERKTNREAARALHCPEGTVVTHLARARQRLRRRLALHGVALSAGGLAILFDQAAAAALSVEFIRRLSASAVSFAAGISFSNGVVGERIVSLAKGVEQAMFFSKLQSGIAVLATVAVIAFGGSVAGYRLVSPGQAREQPPRCGLSEVTALDPQDAVPAPRVEQRPDEAKLEQPFHITTYYTPEFEGGALGQPVLVPLVITVPNEWQASVAKLIPPAEVVPNEAEKADKPLKITTFFEPKGRNGQPVPFTIEIPAGVPAALQTSIARGISDLVRVPATEKDSQKLDTILKRLDNIERKLREITEKHKAD